MGRFRSSVAIAVGLLAGTTGSLADRSTLTVSSASSLQDVVRLLVGAFAVRRPGLEIHLNSGASSLLARQIEEGAPVDLFLSADDHTIDHLIDRGWIDSASVAVIATNRVVAVAPADRFLLARDPTDLAGPQIRRVALCDSTVPIGRYAGTFLRATGLLDALEGRLVRTENVRASLAAAITGAVDLAFVYETDARLSDRVRTVWTVRPDLIPPVRAYGAIVRRPRGSPAAADFLSFLRSPEARAAFEAAGFGSPGDASR